MLNRLVSNFVLGFFVVVLVVVYSVAKQVPGYQSSAASSSSSDKLESDNSEKTNDVTVAGDLTGKVLITAPNGNIITANVASTEEARTRGLSGTDLLSQGEGMLFVFDAPGNYGIWMRDMKYDIDIVWLDSEGKVVKVVAGAKAPVAGASPDELVTYKNADQALYVLELPSGAAAESGLILGAQVTL